MSQADSRGAINAMLRPRSVAVIGATERMQYGGRLMANLLQRGYDGLVIPVNPRRQIVMGVPCVPDVRDAPRPVDLAVIVIPADGVPDAIAACGEAGIPIAVVVSAGYAESGTADGVSRQETLEAAARAAGVRICGPNCLGVANLAEHLWATANVLVPIDERLKVGGLAVVSQSGATAFGPILVAARDRAIGIRYVVSSGNEVDLTTADYIDYLVADRDVSAIACVLEGVRDGAALRVAFERALAADKPVVVLKIGRTEAGANAARTHTAALAGHDDVFEALIQQCGVTRADDWDELLSLATALERSPRPAGRGVAVVSHSGGIGGIVADHCASAGLEVPELEEYTTSALADILEGRGAARNPADITGHYERETLSDILAALLDDPGIDTLAVATAGSSAVSTRIAEAARSTDKPVVVCWTGGADEVDGLRVIRERHLAIVDQPRDCARAIAALCDWSEARRRLSESILRPTDAHGWGQLQLLRERNGAELLPEHVGLALMAAAGIPVAGTLSVTDPKEATSAVRSTGLRAPYVVKIDSPDLPHKSDAGGVVLDIEHSDDLSGAAAMLVERVRRAAPDARIRGVVIQEMAPGGLEVALGMHLDPQYGSVVTLALGGVLVETLARAERRIAPLRPSDVVALVEGCPGLEQLLRGSRGAPPYDRAALVDAVGLFSAWAHDVSGAVVAAEINPLIVMPRGRGVVAVDCLILPRAVS